MLSSNTTEKGEQESNDRPEVPRRDRQNLSSSGLGTYVVFSGKELDYFH